MKRVPFLLIYSRLICAILIAILAIYNNPSSPLLIVIFMTLGLLTDVFDGIIARKLNVSSERLRVWDSNVDQFFWIITIGSIFYLNIEFLKREYIWILLILFLEILCYITSYYKFKRTIATHSILSKIWTLTLLFFLIDLTLTSNSNIPFLTCLILGIISRVEIMLIIFKLKKWTTDVPSIFSVSKINKGTPIKKNKLFNG